jgi:hypothetical protein
MPRTPGIGFFSFFTPARQLPGERRKTRPLPLKALENGQQREVSPLELVPMKIGRFRGSVGLTDCFVRFRFTPTPRNDGANLLSCRPQMLTPSWSPPKNRGRSLAREAEGVRNVQTTDCFPDPSGQAVPRIDAVEPSLPPKCRGARHEAGSNPCKIIQSLPPKLRGLQLINPST